MSDANAHFNVSEAKARRLTWGLGLRGLVEINVFPKSLRKTKSKYVIIINNISETKIYITII